MVQGRVEMRKLIMMAAAAGAAMAVVTAACDPSFFEDDASDGTSSAKSDASGKEVPIDTSVVTNFQKGYNRLS